VLDNALDRAVLAGRIPALQDDQYLVIAVDEMSLQLNQFALELVQVMLVVSFPNRGRVRPLFFLFYFFAYVIRNCRASCLIAQSVLQPAVNRAESERPYHHHDERIEERAKAEKSWAALQFAKIKAVKQPIHECCGSLRPKPEN